MVRKIGCLLVLACAMMAHSALGASASARQEKPRDLSVNETSEEKAVDQETAQTIEDEFGPSGGNPDKIGALKKSETGEDKTPVFVKPTAAKTESSNPFFRMIIALGVICVAGLGALVYIKKFKKLATTKGPAPKIQVLTQHFLGPKKSLAIVKIAGESILIGITDHNITPIRVLALLDDELPVQNPADFNAAMQGLDFVDDTKDQFEFHAPGNYR